MSIAALNWAWTQECPNATSKLVLLALADKANEDGECWPGMGTVAEMAGVSSRQVSTHLARLEGAGLIRRKRRRSKLGRLGEYVFHLNLSTGTTLPVDHRKSTSGSTPPVEAGYQWKPSVDDHRKPASGQEASLKEQPPLTPLAPKARKGRRPDPIWDAVIGACGLDPSELTRSARGAANTAVAQLREIGATPEGIHARAKIHLSRWPNATLTPTSLAKNYAQLGASRNGSRSPPPADACQQCAQPLASHDDDLHRILVRHS